MSAESWKDEVTKRRGEYSARRKSAHPTNASGCSSWPTPTTAEGSKIGSQANYGQVGLSNHPAIVGLPDREKLKKDGKSQESWGTPTAVGRGARSPETMAKCLEFRKTKGKNSVPLYLEEQAGEGVLNPNWVEQLMGLEHGWTQLPTDWTG
jgi:hypothetical protein